MQLMMLQIAQLFSVTEWVNVRESYQDAISSPESSKWRDAMNEELDALWDNETF